jgi:putative ABC transport system permease protein
VSYEAAILKTLGASSRLIAAMLLLEYGVLGAIAGTVGALGAIALSWAVARYALDLTWHATPAITVIGITVTAVCVRRDRRARQPRRSPPQTARDASS